MTLARQPAHALRRARIAAVSAALALFAVLASAGAEAAEANAKPSVAAERSWLRGGAPAKKAAAPAPAAPSRWRVLVMGVLVLGLGGAAVTIQRKRRVVVRAVRSDLTVLTTTRVGPKSQVAVVSVGGRKLLLGVTDAHVSSLGWLDAEPDAAPVDVAPVEEEPALIAAPAEPVQAAAARISAALRTAQQAEAGPRRFRDALKTAIGRSEPEVEAAAVTLARATEDVVVTRASRQRASAALPTRVAAPAGAPEMVDIEGQARGLILRLQKR